MAFGKDKSTFVSKMNARQQMRRSTKRPAKTGGGGGLYFLNKFTPPVTGPAALIRLIPGQYAIPRVDMEAKDFVYGPDNKPVMDEYSYYKYVEYFHGIKKKGCIGSEGPLGIFKGKGERCLAAEWYWYEYNRRQKTGAKKPNSMRRSERWAVTALVQAPFYKAPSEDRDGRRKINPSTGEPYYNWTAGSRKRNDELAAAGYDSKDGHLQHWSMPYGHWAVLTEHSDVLANHCRACGAQDSIEEVALLCQGCGDAVVEMNSTSLSEEELAQLRDEEVRCPFCGFTGYLEDMIRCTSCTQGERATIFDFDLEVKRVKTTGSDGNEQTALQILRALGPRGIPTVYGDDLRKPLDLPRIFSPTSNEQQEAMYGVPPDADDPILEEEEEEEEDSEEEEGLARRTPTTRRR